MYFKQRLSPHVFVPIFWKIVATHKIKNLMRLSKLMEILQKIIQNCKFSHHYNSHNCTSFRKFIMIDYRYNKTFSINYKDLNNKIKK